MQKRMVDNVSGGTRVPVAQLYCMLIPPCTEYQNTAFLSLGSTLHFRP